MEESYNTAELFNTKDIILAATLKVNGYKLIKIEKDYSRGTFFFESISEEWLSDYDLGNILVQPIDFNNAVKQLTTSVRRLA